MRDSSPSSKQPLLLDLERVTSWPDLSTPSSPTVGSIGWFQALFSNKRFVSILSFTLIWATIWMWLTLPTTGPGEKVSVGMMIKAKMQLGPKPPCGGQVDLVAFAPPQNPLLMPAKPHFESSLLARYLIEYLVYLYKVDSIVDLGVGWFPWDVTLDRIRKHKCVTLYGLDASQDLVEARKEMMNRQTKFSWTDVSLGVPHADFIVARDVFHTMTLEQVKSTLIAIKAAKPRLVLLGNHADHDLTLEPFNLVPRKVYAEVQDGREKSLMFFEWEDVEKWSFPESTTSR